MFINFINVFFIKFTRTFVLTPERLQYYIGGYGQKITILHRGGSGQMITILHRGGYGQKITILHREGGVYRDPQK